ncbi:MAG: glycosyltransferase family 2 protein [Candidatus Pacebacteria bacterium]|nr:glycosyltransferase family 2 protein [Candidatus Paceibacterota bacterium]
MDCEKIQGNFSYNGLTNYSAELSIMRIYAIIPAYNEERNIGKVIEGIKKYTNNIIVVDDGSNDGTSKIARKEGVKVYRHIINRGLGGALGTGIKAALSENADIILTIDADGQHDPEEIPNLLKPIVSGDADVVIGSRFLKNQRMPIFRKTGNYFFNFITFLFFGIWSTDSQSGMRVFNKKAAESLRTLTSGMEVSSEIMTDIKTNELRLKEVPIRAIYTSYSLSKGQGFWVGLKTLAKLFILKITK